MTKLTVNVRSPRAIILRLYRQLPPPDIHLAPDPAHDPVVLCAGANPGIDRKFFAAWLDQNKTLAEDVGITAEDESPPEQPEGS